MVSTRCRHVSLGFAVGFLILVSGCHRAIPITGGSKADTNSHTALQVQLGAEPVSLDPAQAEDGVSLQVLANVMDGLYCYDGAGTLEACLAGKTEISSDRRHYTFTLRPEARWSDGQPVAVADFVRGFQRALDPKQPGKLAGNFDIIHGARAYRSGKTAWDTVGIAARDEKLVIDLDEPIADFLDVLTLPGAYPARDGKWTEDGPTTGAYHLAHHTPDEHVLLDVNEECWRRMVKGQRPLRPVMLRIVTDEMTGLSLFESGRLDILSRIPNLEMERAKSLGTLRTDPFYSTYYLGINVKSGKFPAAMRRQWDRAILREPIVKALGTGDYPARTWVPAGIEGSEAWTGDLPASSPAVGKPVKIEAGFDNSDRNRQIMEIVQKQLKAIGVEATLTPGEWKSYIQRIETNTPDLYRMGWMTPIRDPIPHLEMLLSDSPNNATGWKNANYDRLVKEIRTMTLGPARVEKIHAAQKILSEEVPVIPLYHYSQKHLLSKRIEDFRVNPFGIMRFEEIRVTGDPKSTR